VFVEGGGAVTCHSTMAQWPAQNRYILLNTRFSSYTPRRSPHSESCRFGSAIAAVTTREQVPELTLQFFGTCPTTTNHPGRCCPPHARTPADQPNIADLLRCPLSLPSNTFLRRDRPRRRRRN